MFTKAELIDAVNELSQGKHSIQTGERLAAIYTVLDHLYPEEIKEPYLTSYSGENEIVRINTGIERYGDTDFLKKITGKDPEEMWLLMDELMSTLAVINSRLYEGVMRKI